jgi:hypothetical protein
VNHFTYIQMAFLLFVMGATSATIESSLSRSIAASTNYNFDYLIYCSGSSSICQTLESTVSQLSSGGSMSITLATSNNLKSSIARTSSHVFMLSLWTLTANSDEDMVDLAPLDGRFVLVQTIPYAGDITPSSRVSLYCSSPVTFEFLMLQGSFTIQDDMTARSVWLDRGGSSLQTFVANAGRIQTPYTLLQLSSNVQVPAINTTSLAVVPPVFSTGEYPDFTITLSAIRRLEFYPEYWIVSTSTNSWTILHTAIKPDGEFSIHLWPDKMERDWEIELRLTPGTTTVSKIRMSITKEPSVLSTSEAVPLARRIREQDGTRPPRWPTRKARDAPPKLKIQFTGPWEDVTDRPTIIFEAGSAGDVEFVDADGSPTSAPSNIDAVKQAATAVPIGEPAPSGGEDKSGLSGGAIAGIVIAVIVVIALIAVAVWYFVIRKPVMQVGREETPAAEQPSSDRAVQPGEQDPPSEPPQHGEQVPPGQPPQQYPLVNKVHLRSNGSLNRCRQVHKLHPGSSGSPNSKLHQVNNTNNTRLASSTRSSIHLALSIRSANSTRSSSTLLVSTHLASTDLPGKIDPLTLF